jgi:hypothetical protein
MSTKKSEMLHIDLKDYQDFLKERKKNIEAAEIARATVRRVLKDRKEKKRRGE